MQARTDKEGKSLPLMAESKLSDFIADPHQKIIYLTDYEAAWNLHIELIKLLPHADEKRNYPVCVKSSGDAPKQYPVVNIPKPIPTVEDELSALLLADGLLSSIEEADEAEDIPEKENLMEEAEDGVELDEIEGMNEEGEEESSEEESEEMEPGDGDEEVQDDQY